MVSWCVQRSNSPASHSTQSRDNPGREKGNEATGLARSFQARGMRLLALLARSKPGEEATSGRGKGNEATGLARSGCFSIKRGC